jgi:hypothetical protein
VGIGLVRFACLPVPLWVVTCSSPGGLLRLVTALAALVAAVPAHAQSGTRTTPDGKQVLISKDVAAERWAITLDLNDGTVTGNVFRQDGDPQFVWCERRGEPLGDPSTTAIPFFCRGADRCASSPCSATSWVDLGDVSLPGSFFLPATDPFSPLRGPTHFCDPLGYGFEELGGEQSYGIESGFCNFVTAMQPTMTAIEPGDEVLVRLWHFALTAPDPGEAYIAIQVGDRMLWQALLPIPCIGGLVGAREDDCPENPNPGSVEPPVFTAGFGAPAGSPVYFHVQNHGQNGYNLIEITIGGGRQLVNASSWTVVTEGLPLFPPFTN